MWTQVELGTLNKVSIRDVWKGEAHNFTPWLAEPQNLDLLGQAICMNLELVKREVPVGEYRLDLLAKNVGSGDFVVIENQFGSTDHSHLGQLLTYAAGIGTDGSGSRTVIWIAEHFAEPHRSALDWLNKVTEPGIGFFGVEVELWRIGNSAPAPKFNLVSKPNNWQKQITQASNALSETELLYQEFWTEFIKYCREKSTNLRFGSPQPQTWLTTPIGRSGYSVNMTVSRTLRKLECQLWIQGPQPKSAFDQIKGQETDILRVLGPKTEFDRMPDRRTTCKVFETRTGDVTDRKQWPELFSWLKTKSEAYVKLFGPMVRAIKFEDVEPDQ